MKVYRVQRSGHEKSSYRIITGYPQDLQNQIPCIFPVLLKTIPRVFCVQNCMLIEHFSNNAASIHRYSCAITTFAIGIKIPCIFPVFFQILIFPVLSLQGKFASHFPCFSCVPCAVGTRRILEKVTEHYPSCKCIVFLSLASTMAMTKIQI